MNAAPDGFFLVWWRGRRGSVHLVAEDVAGPPWRTLCGIDAKADARLAEAPIPERGEDGPCWFCARAFALGERRIHQRPPPGSL